MENTGVDFPAGPDGRRGTSAAGRAVVAAALRPVDPAAAAAVERESRWRTAYLAQFRRLVEAGLDSPADWLAIARAGLAEVDRRLCVVRPDGTEAPLPAVLTDPAERELKTDEVRGPVAPTEFVLPYGRELLRGDDIRRRVDAWIAAGVAEPSLAGPVEEVLRHPEWLRLDGWTVATLGAGAEMGPLPTLLRWGATVAAVDLPSPAIWTRLQAAAAAGAGRLLIPSGPGGGPDGRWQPGADLVA